MLKRKTTVKYYSHVFDFIFHMPYCIVNCYLKRLSPFIEIWCCKKNALSFIWIQSTEKPPSKLAEIALVLMGGGENLGHGGKLWAKVASVSGPWAGLLVDHPMVTARRRCLTSSGSSPRNACGVKSRLASNSLNKSAKNQSPVSKYYHHCATLTHSRLPQCGVNAVKNCSMKYKNVSTLLQKWQAMGSI